MNIEAGAQPNKSVIDGLQTLQALASYGAPIGGRELARHLGLDATRVNRLLKTLTFLGFAHQTPDRKYTTGSAMHVLASQSLFASQVIPKAVPLLETLDKTDLIVAMGVRWRNHVSYIYHAEPGMTGFQALGRFGHRHVTESGIGMALIAHLDDHKIREIYTHQQAPNFNTMDELLLEIEKIRKNGYAYYLSNPEFGHHTVAIAIGKNNIFSIGLSGLIPQASLGDTLKELRSVASKIDEALSSPV